MQAEPTHERPVVQVRLGQCDVCAKPRPIIDYGWLYRFFAGQQHLVSLCPDCARGWER